uniref:BolA protein n=1 Tax=Araucaria cunninghamii TaxID=56994 RepID=A0A0D6QYI6_ARACU
MGSRGSGAVLGVIMSRASRIRQKLESTLEPTMLEVEDVSYQHAGHEGIKGSSATETHFNLKIVSPKFEGQNLVKRHRFVYDLLNEELKTGLHALSIVAKTPAEVQSK